VGVKKDRSVNAAKRQRVFIGAPGHTAHLCFQLQNIHWRGPGSDAIYYFKLTAFHINISLKKYFNVRKISILFLFLTKNVTYVKRNFLLHK